MTTPPSDPSGPTDPIPPQTGPYGQLPPRTGPYGQYPPQYQPPYWQPVPPPRKRRTGAVVAGIAAAVVLLVAIPAGAYLAFQGAPAHRPEVRVAPSAGSSTPATSPTSAEPSPPTGHLPKTLLGGAYTLKKNFSSTLDVGSGGLYRSSRPDSFSILLLPNEGLDPQTFLAQLIRPVSTNDKAKVVIPARRITPPGGRPMTCEAVVYPDLGPSRPMAFCAWADTASGGSVEETEPVKSAGYPYSVNLTAYAALVERIRAELGA